VKRRGNPVTLTGNLLEVTTHYQPANSEKPSKGLLFDGGLRFWNDNEKRCPMEQKQAYFMIKCA
jgi:hypothetical protein